MYESSPRETGVHFLHPSIHAHAPQQPNGPPPRDPSPDYGRTQAPAGPPSLLTRQHRPPFALPTQPLPHPVTTTSRRTLRSHDDRPPAPRSLARVTVNPGYVMAIEVFISSSLKGAHVLLEPSQQLPKLGLAGAKCLVDILNNEIHYMQVINPTTDPITLSANTCIASATVVNPDTVLSLDNPEPSNTDSDPKPPQGCPIDFDLSDSDLNPTQKLILLAFLNKHRSVFATELSELGNCAVQSHRIETGDEFPVRQRFYRQSPEVNAEMNRQLEEMLEVNIIEESTSMWQSPVVMPNKLILKKQWKKFKLLYQLLPT
uniref:Uncharacterized protein n=1 Tax=Magallana gigas TaxID=29159 RepID=A0A8W8MNX8_MAGGI